MARQRFFLLILVTCLSTSVVSCHRLLRWLDLDPGAQAPISKQVTQAAEKTLTQTHCCWCVVKATSQNSTQNYFGQASCEVRSNRAPYAACREVVVGGATCNLVRVTSQGGRLQCTPHPLHFTEAGIARVIAPPDDYELTCKAQVLVRAAQAHSGQLIDNGESGGPSGAGDDTYCTCEPDLDHEGNCRVVKFTHGIPSTLDSRARHEGQTSCSREVCNSLFKQADYRTACPRYVDGEG